MSDKKSISGDMPGGVSNRGGSGRGCVSRRTAGFLWLAVMVALGLALRFDLTIMRWRYALIGENPEGLLRQVLQGFRDFAQVVPIIVALIIVATYDPRRKHIIAVVLIAQAFASVGYNSGKLTIARHRPSSEFIDVRDPSLRLADTWIGWVPGNHEGQTQSFPSGHSGAAFAFAGALAFFYPKLRALLWTLAVGCALSRYLDAVHWMSDCVAGGIIGYLGAWLALRLDRWVGVKRLGCPDHSAQRLTLPGESLSE